ncbi:MAG: hypothetical protein IPG44_09575 [Anaerolineales bacterium]|nr:hypothetical protein [Anaerolineales bacterium]
MQNEKRESRFEFLQPIVFLALAAAVYLIFVPRFGYFKDDWYLMYAAGTRGAAAFWDIFAVDRPLRALVMIPAYSLFGADPLYYNISAYLLRVLGALAFYWSLNLLWARQKGLNLIGALLFLVYPGFLSQPNAIDYQSHIFGLAAGMFSVALTLYAAGLPRPGKRVGLLLLSLLSGWLYLGQMEWYIGLEAFRWLGVFFIVQRDEKRLFRAAWESLRRVWLTLLISGGFLYWRLFIFESERGATDVDLQLSDVLGDPFKYFLQWLAVLGDDMLDSTIRAWYVPLRRLTLGFSASDWIPALGIALLTAAIWILFQRRKTPRDGDSGGGSGWRREAVLLGIALVVFGLLPVIMVGRSVDFRNFSRYTLVASAGTAILLQAGLSFVSSARWRTALVSVLLVSASLTHYANGLAHARETERMNAFWWQAAWRIPHLGQGVTLLAHYHGIVIEEDYFVWGPASLVYYPESTHADYPQPGVYAVLAGGDTVEKILAQERQEFSNRRSIRTYPNYRNILIISQPARDSCAQVITGAQPEYSSLEEKRLMQVGSFSEVEHILTAEAPHTPPRIPFGDEPEHGWCFYYEKASLARQTNDWDEAARLGDEAMRLGFAPADQVEWLPFLQAYGMREDFDALKVVALQITDEKVRGQACVIFGELEAMSSKAGGWFREEFCSSGQQ